MKEKQEEAIPYMLSLLSNLPMDLSKLTTAYDHPGGLDGAQVAKKANGISLCCGFTPANNQTPHSHSLTVPPVGWGSK